LGKRASISSASRAAIARRSDTSGAIGLSLRRLARSSKRAAVPSGRMASIARTLSRIVPKRRERAPQELLPAMPPSVAREAVETSTGNQSP
jgi:hypothetical protein